MRRLQILSLALMALEASALWPFQPKRFTAEALINAGPLGLESMDGRVVAMGDWDGDQHADLFSLSGDKKTLRLHLWDRDKWQYTLSPHALTLSSSIVNVVPADFDHDGRLDLLVMYEDGKGEWWGGREDRIGMRVYFGQGKDGFRDGDEWSLGHSSLVQPMVFDADGSLRPSLLGYEAGNTDTPRAWVNNGTGLGIGAPPLRNLDDMCQLVNPHSSAFVDIDGDCMPDLVLHCESARTEQRTVQIWSNRGSSGYVHARDYTLPSGSGPLSFADMDRDGTLDIVFPTCRSRSTSSGIGYDCSINIAYNKQVPVCSTEGSQGDGNRLKCRGWGDLCVADHGFDFDLSEGSESLTTIPLSSLIPGAELLLHPAGQASIPLALRPGDYNVDGFPDLLVTVYNATAAPPSGVFGGRGEGTQVKVLENVPCGKGVAGCEAAGAKRGFRVGGGKGWEGLEGVWDASGASWLDVDDDGSLDIMVQRTGDQGEGRVSFVQNNFYHDAFFLKALVLNGACDGQCEPVDGGKKYSGLGVGYSGATYKFTVLDTLGRRVAQQVAQLPQTGYHALHTPYSFIGLGRTNNYIERLFVGASLVVQESLGRHFTSLDSLIPNSQVIINPPSPGAANSTRQPPRDEWRSELFLHPGDWVPWVAAAVVGTVVVLGFVVLGLDRRERKEDERERRRVLHAINFQAL